MNRTENGSTAQAEHGLINTADLTAKLSGVSLTTVTKVIAALDAIHQTLAVHPSDLIDFARTPTTLPDRERSTRTEMAYERVVRERDMLSDDHWETLKPGRNAA